MIDSTTVEMKHALIARVGVTTANGAAGGNSLIDAGLIGYGVNSFVSMTVLIYPGVPNLVDTIDITAFNNATGEVTFGRNYKGGQVLAGTPYKILTFRPAIAEVHGVFTVIPSCPESVEPDTAQSLDLSISTVEGIPAAANLTAGTITIVRVRAGVETTIVNAAACAVADGRIYYNYTFPAASWQAGDEYKAVFSGQAVLVGATTYALSDIRCKGRISREAVISTGIIDRVAQTTGTFSYDETLATEQTMVTLTISARAIIGGIWIDMVNVTQDTTIRVKHQIDGANYRTFETNAWVTTDEDGVLITGFTAYRNVQISLQCGGGGAGSVNVPYAIV